MDPKTFQIKDMTEKGRRPIPVDAPIAPEDFPYYKAVEDLFTNNGNVSFKDTVDGKERVAYGKISYEDMIVSGDLLRFVPKVVTYLLRAGVEPRLVVANTLFKQLTVDQKILVDVGYFGPLEAYEQPEGRDWKESQIQFNGGDMIQPITYRTIGVQFRITEEAKKVGGYDVIRLQVSEAAKALVRYKEQRCVDALELTGAVLYDNTPANAGILGYTTGRNVTSAFNGTMSLNDLMGMYTFMTMRGMNPDTLLMTPLAWMTFAVSPDTREIVTSGNVVTSAPMPNGGNSGMPNRYEPFGLNTNSGTGTMSPDTIFGKIGINPFVTTINPLNATYEVNSKYFPGGLRIIVTPFMRYTENAGAVSNVNTSLPSSEIIIADSQRTGIIVTSDPVSMKTYDDFWTTSSVFRLGETYGVEMIYQGQGVGIAKGIIIDRNYNFENVNSVTITNGYPTTNPSNA